MNVESVANWNSDPNYLPNNRQPNNYNQTAGYNGAHRPSGEYLSPGAALQHPGVQLAMQDLTGTLDMLQYPAVITNDVGQPLYRNSSAMGRIDTRNDVLALTGATTGQELRSDVQISRLSAAGLTTYYLVVWKCTGDRVASRLAECRQMWSLTRRQYQVLELLVRGKDNRTIGDAIGCSGRTVELHVSGLLEKSGCSTRAELIAHYWEGAAL